MELSTEQITYLKTLKRKMRITKVVRTRSIKARNGDYFVGFSAAWDTMQEDASGQGADLIDAMDEGEATAAHAQQGMTLKESKLSLAILGMHTDLAAIDQALAGGGISKAEADRARAATTGNYTALLSGYMNKPPKPTGDS